MTETDTAVEPSRRTIGSLLALDPKKDKQALKARIVHQLEGTLEGADVAEIRAEVEREYEHLLEGATVTVHIATLTEGSVKQKLLYGT